MPYVSFIPRRIVLGEHPVRVFLSCREPAFEVTGIEGDPGAVSVDVDSARSVRLSRKGPIDPNSATQVVLLTNSDRCPRVVLPVSLIDVPTSE